MGGTSLLPRPFYQGIRLPSQRRKRPESATLNLSTIARMPLTFVSEVIGALHPPMRVRNQPGWRSTTPMPWRSSSSAGPFMAALRAALLEG